jgi:hypothetical protein
MAARAFRIVWLTALVSHVISAALWWWLTPGGFPLGHSRFFANRVAPITVLILAIAALWALHRDRAELLRYLLPIWPAAWAATALAGRLLFPISLALAWLVPLAVAAMMALAAIPVFKRSGASLGITPIRRVGQLGSIAASAIAASGLVLAQRAPVASTQPANCSFPELESALTRPMIQPGAVRLGNKALIQTSDGSITVPVAEMTLIIEPILTFSSQSPDGCPVVLVRPSDRAGPEPRFRQGHRGALRSVALFYNVASQGPAFLRAFVGPAGRSLVVEALTQLDRAVYSHLNSFCELEIRRHRKLSLEFSPCPRVPIEVRRFDYPFGRPARFAYLDSQDRFYVVEAESGEMGPFHTLARGRLKRDEPLSITMFDEARPRAKITLEDWAPQSDTTLSPTAGWGVPVNAIEFSLSGDAPQSPASIFVTLAGTSVGRGWECVGHVAGTYRNRIVIEQISDQKQASSRSAPARQPAEAAQL